MLSRFRRSWSLMRAGQILMREILDRLHGIAQRYARLQIETDCHRGELPGMRDALRAGVLLHLCETVQRDQRSVRRLQVKPRAACRRMPDIRSSTSSITRY